MERSNEIKSYTIREAIIAGKEMWAGGTTRRIIKNLNGITEDNKVINLQLEHTPAFLKAMDEYIVNAIDQFREHPNDVTNISVKFLFPGNVFEIYNNGSGIDIIKDKNGIYLPEKAFTIPLTTSNMEKTEKSSVGGSNGIGCKIGAFYSSIFEIETVDSRRHKKYFQRFLNRVETSEQPIIEKYTGVKYTKIHCSFLMSEFGYSDFSIEEFNEISEWLKWRCELAQSYIGTSCSISLNDNSCRCFSSSDLSTLFYPDSNIVNTRILGPLYHYFDISIIIKGGEEKIKNLSILNGVYVPKGNHLTWIKKKIIDAVNKTSQLPTKQITSRFSVFLIGTMGNLDWNSQVKDRLSIDIRRLDDYNIPKEFITDAANRIRESIDSLLKKKGTKKTADPVFKKYTKAPDIGKKNIDCSLIIAEGDSAMITIRPLVLQLEDRSRYGLYSIKGVPINALKKTKNLGGRIIESNQLMNNIEMNELKQIIGLNEYKTYASQEERDSLRYKSLIICTDQDLDGIGKILPLIMVFFHVKWPELLKNGFVKRWVSPIIKVLGNKNKNIIRSFYSEESFNQWRRIQKEERLKKCRIKYYKGLAGHPNEHILDLANNFVKKHQKFIISDVERVKKCFETYFGKETSERKIELLRPIVSNGYVFDATEMDIDQFLGVESKSYKLYAIKRQIPNVIDGLKIASRKVLMGAINLWEGNNDPEMKVYQFCGNITEKMSYHHGDISGTVFDLTRTFPGARRYPLLHGEGQFGSRYDIKAFPAPRYVDVCLNRDLVSKLFPRDDMWHLEYITEENGRKAEPVNFVPVLPFALFENGRCPSEGWKHEIFGRNVDQIINIVKEIIQYDKFARITADRLNEEGMTDELIYAIFYLNEKYKIFPCLKQFPNCDYQDIYDEETISAKYEIIDNDKILIKNLPPYVSVKDFETLVCRKDLVKSVTDNRVSGSKMVNQLENEVNMTINLKQNGMDIINQMFQFSDNPVYNYFPQLKITIKPYANFYSNKFSRVLCFRHFYIGPLLLWFSERKELYLKRVKRKIILLGLKLEFEEWKLKFLMEETPELMRDREIEKKLIEKGYPMFNSEIINSPKDFMANNPMGICKSVLTENASYDYLLDLRVRDFGAGSIESRHKRAENIRAEFGKYKEYLSNKPFPCANLWLEEIEELKVIIEEISSAF